VRSNTAVQAVSSPFGRITIASEAIAQIVAETARECYGVVAMAGPRWLPERVRKGIGISRAGDEVTIDVHVVVEYGLNLAEVASSVRNRVSYEVERMTGLPVRAVEVHIDGVRRNT
jgi:uncharacterized alkaline shock family protein YloU